MTIWQKKNEGSKRNIKFSNLQSLFHLPQFQNLLKNDILTLGGQLVRNCVSQTDPPDDAWALSTGLL